MSSSLRVEKYPEGREGFLQTVINPRNIHGYLAIRGMNDFPSVDSKNHFKDLLEF